MNLPNFARSAARSVPAALTLVVASCGGGDRGAAPIAEIEAAVERCRTSANELGAELSAELGRAIASSGAVGAIETCQLRAPQIAQQVGSARELVIDRTALRVRNPNHVADAWEAEKLEEFAAQIGSVPNPAGLEAMLVGEVEGGWSVRWMRAIVMQPMCTACHGDAIEAPVAAELARRYPDDQAVGFAPGELRGAFSARTFVPRR